MENNEIRTDWLNFQQTLKEYPIFSPRYLRYLVDTEQIPFSRPTPRKTIFSRKAIERWLQKHMVEVE
jgi:hypothetical protein